MTNKQRVSKRGLRSQQFAAATHVLWNPPTATLEINHSQTWLPPLTGRKNRPGELLQGLRGHFHVFQTPTYVQPWTTWKCAQSPLTHSSPGTEPWSAFLWLWRSETGSGRSAADTTQGKHTEFPAAMSTMLGTWWGVSVVSGWTPHPDTWQTVLSRLCRNRAGFWRCSRLLWLTLWIQECC